MAKQTSFTINTAASVTTTIVASGGCIINAIDVTWVSNSAGNFTFTSMEFQDTAASNLFLRNFIGFGIGIYNDRLSLSNLNIPTTVNGGLQIAVVLNVAGTGTLVGNIVYTTP